MYYALKGEMDCMQINFISRKDKVEALEIRSNSKRLNILMKTLRIRNYNVKNVLK